MTVTASSVAAAAIENAGEELPACVKCGKPFIVKDNTTGKFCSSRCWYDWNRDQHFRPCERCGAPFHKPRKAKKRDRYCSLECGRLSWQLPRTAEEPAAVEGCRWIALQKGKFALVDASRFDELSRHLWTFGGRYAFTRVNGKIIHMHKLVAAIPDGELGDHINGNALDNREANIRRATPEQNARNVAKKLRSGKATSKYKGVHRSAQSGRYQAMIRVSGRTKFLGCFVAEDDAARAYDAAARVHFGEFACVNFPRPGERSAIATADPMEKTG